MEKWKSGQTSYFELQETQNIVSEFSDIEDESEFLGNQSDTNDNGSKSLHIDSSDDENLVKNNGDKSSDEEDSVPLHNIQKRICMRFPFSSAEDNERGEDTQLEVSAGGTIWKK